MIRVDSITKSFQTVNGDNRTIIHDLSMSVESGQSASIRGASGSGKSTLLHLLCGLDSPDSGHISVDDQALPQLTESQLDDYRRTQIGIVFQQFHLIESLNVLDNIEFTARISGRFNSHYIEHLASRLGLQQLISTPIPMLSGGEQQRVAIARALAHQPKVVFADEPTGNLDEENSERVSELLFTTCRELSTCLVCVTHSALVADQADQVLHMHAGKLEAN
jgi:putative ABC transport system ATP-binding protein